MEVERRLLPERAVRVGQMMRHCNWGGRRAQEYSRMPRYPKHRSWTLCLQDFDHKRPERVEVAAVFSRRRTSACFLCTGLGALFLSSGAMAQSNYLVPLPQNGTVVALNNSGQILYDTGLLTGNTFVAFPAGFVAGPEPGHGNLSESGVIAGTTTTGHLATYSAGTVTDLGQPPWQFQTVYAAAINASGQIAGYTYGNVGPPAAPPSFIYSGGVFSPINITTGPDLDPPGAQAVDINDSGQVVLSGPSTITGCHGFLVTGAALTDLGADCPRAINAGGQITGATGDVSGKSEHAFIWANGMPTVLAEPPPFTGSVGLAINKGGQIVGSMGNTQSSAPFFYNGVMTDINSLVSASDPLKSTVTIASVVDINDSRLLLLVSTVPVVGSSTAYVLQAPWLDVAPGPLAFPSQAVGTASQPQQLTLTNSGSVPLALDKISFAPGAADYSQTNTCPQSLAAGANCTVLVTFAPSAAEVQNGFLDVVTGGATITVPLAGTTPLTISLSATPTTPTVGQPFTITWTATPGFACQSSGGSGENDGWTAATDAGSVSVVEGNTGTYTYTLTCSADGVSSAQSLNVMVVYPSTSGGGGTLDLTSLLLLVGLLASYRATLRSRLS